MHFGRKGLLLLTKNAPTKRCQKNGQGPPPSNLDKIPIRSVFSGDLPLESRKTITTKGINNTILNSSTKPQHQPPENFIRNIKDRSTSILEQSSIQVLDKGKLWSLPLGLGSMNMTKKRVIIISVPPLVH